MCSFQYDASNDTYICKSGNVYIKNEFDPMSPEYVDISSEVWRGSRNGEEHKINWGEFNNLTVNMIESAKTTLKNSLKYKSVQYIQHVKLTLRLINDIAIKRRWRSWGEISIRDWQAIWESGNSQKRSTLRGIYKQLSLEGLDGASLSILYELERWKSRKNVIHLREVRNWDAELGALTTSEVEQLRRCLDIKPINKPISYFAGRISVWCIVETFKRSSQITKMSKDALKEVGSQYFLEIPGAKAQVGTKKLWPISLELAENIKAFSKIPEVSKLQNEHGKLIVTNSPSLRQHGQIQSAVLKSYIGTYIKEMGILSHRTGKRLNITPLRLRHTGATKLAEHGFPRDVIADILEHDSYGSADAYIDAVGSDLIPAVERADRQLGKLFSEISDAFFKGKIVDAKEATKLPPIIIPIIEDSPAIVGSCGRDTITEGKCSRHPFMGCYDNCPSFLAWKEADHHKSLQYIETEYERWDSAGGHQERWKARSEFERVYQAVNDVIQQIENQNE